MAHRDVPAANQHVFLKIPPARTALNLLVNGADVMNIHADASSLKRAKTLIDTALTLNAMHLDLLVVRHPYLALLICWRKGGALNGDGKHPTQAFDGLTIRRASAFAPPVVAICGDIAHSRVARSNIMLLRCKPDQLIMHPAHANADGKLADFAAKFSNSMEEGLKDVNAVMMLRLRGTHGRWVYPVRA
jgi:aspartate carbamoyltransferase catalytic subunit